ncbi:shikimate kinase AroK [soil metagenome]
MPLWLVGMMGSGKTTIGRQVADRLDKPFRDTDQMIEDMAGMPITQIFDQEGEPGFRHREAEAVRIAARDDDAVIATGGGVLTQPENRLLLKSSGTVVWLRASVETLLKRIGQTRDRPLLRGADRRTALANLLAERTTAYTQGADFTIDTDELDAEQAAVRIEAMWNA